MRNTEIDKKSYQDSWSSILIWFVISGSSILFISWSRFYMCFMNWFCLLQVLVSEFIHLNSWFINSSFPNTEVESLDDGNIHIRWLPCHCRRWWHRRSASGEVKFFYLNTIEDKLEKNEKKKREKVEISSI